MRRQEEESGTEPLLRLQHLLASGKIPGKGECATCHQPNEDVRYFNVQSPVPQISGQFMTGVALALFALLFYIVSFHWVLGLLVLLAFWQARKRRKAEAAELRQIDLRLPLRLCQHCWQQLDDETDIRRVLCQIPEYRELFDRYSNLTCKAV